MKHTQASPSRWAYVLWSLAVAALTIALVYLFESNISG
jgi:hypothetical protein